MRLACAIVLVVRLVLPAKAQDERGWSFSGSFSGSSNTDGIVMKTDPTLGYTFSSHFQTYAGVPFYFVNMSSTAPTTGTVSTGSGFVNGIGNAFLGGRLDVSGDALSYSSTLELTAPTGDKARGFTTGRATADWTNRFSHKMDSFTPFGSAIQLVAARFFCIQYAPLTNAFRVLTRFRGKVGLAVKTCQFCDFCRSACRDIQCLAFHTHTAH